MMEHSRVPFVPWKPSDVLWAVAPLVALVVYGLVAGGRGQDRASTVVTVVAIVLQGVLFLAIAAGFSIVRYKARIGDLGLRRPSFPRAYSYALKAWALALGAVIAYSLLVTQFGISFLEPPATADELIDSTGGFVIAWVLAGLWAPLTEEIFFRGFVLPGLVHKYGIGIGVVMVSGVFALVHVQPGTAGAVVPTFALGVALAMAYVRSGSLLPCVFIHALHNTVAILLARYAGGLNV